MRSKTSLEYKIRKDSEPVQGHAVNQSLLSVKPIEHSSTKRSTAGEEPKQRSKPSLESNIRKTSLPLSEPDVNQINPEVRCDNDVLAKCEYPLSTEDEEIQRSCITRSTAGKVALRDTSSCYSTIQQPSLRVQTSLVNQIKTNDN
ncbi:unnamed protein product [Mytilus edulis]|uniref:Uncharacterized protein n=1 Tax=Mytilus edulis TaxID=6550 RepID=A0A8S3SXR2_MYTED|nr:unnamed protein product [Mytilus edulis]